MVPSRHRHSAHHRHWCVMCVVDHVTVQCIVTFLETLVFIFGPRSDGGDEWLPITLRFRRISVDRMKVEVYDKDQIHNVCHRNRQSNNVRWCGTKPQ